MTKLLNLTIRINNSTNYKNDASDASCRIIEPISLEIKDQNGSSVSKLKTHIKVSNISGGELPIGNIRKIKISSSPSLDIPISWAWENKGSSGEVEFILKKIKYDEKKGFWDGGGLGVDTLFLGQDDFEVETFESRGEKYFHSWQVFEVEGNKYEIPTFHEFSDLYWKIVKAREDESITLNCPLDIEVKRWKNASPFDDKGAFCETESINGNVKEAEKICEDFLKEVRELNTWKTKGIKTLLAAQVAKKNGFDIITDPSLKSQITNGKYKGFSVADGEKYQRLSKGSISSSFFSALFSPFVDFSVIKNRFTKKNIDVFRKLFPNNQDQTDPKYFLGFRPGEVYLNNGRYYSYNHRQDFKEKKTSFFEIEPDKSLTRTYYEFWSCNKALDLEGRKTIKEIIFRPEAFNELPNKNKKEHWDIYWKWLNELLVSVFVENYFGKLHRQLTKLLPLLDKSSFAGESKTDLEVALKVLRNYESPAAGSDQEAIEKKFSSEIKAKRAEITSLIKKPLAEDIDAAANEDYGSGPLNSERKRIFTTLRDQIRTSALIDEIKNLIKLLVKGENLISGTKWLEKKILSNQLKKEYQNGLRDKKTAYNLVNQVDNQWVDRIIADLEKLDKKDPVILLAECRTQLLTKYDNSTLAQTIFGNNVLDSVAALEKAELLLTKVREAEAQSDTDASLLKFLQSYQKAETGTLKNKAWQAVNGYNQQVETAIKHLQKNDQSREEIVKSIQEAKNESELEEAYNQAQNSELYQQGGKSKAVIDSLEKRKKVLFQIEQSVDISPSNKTLFQIILTKIIPDTIKDDDDEQELTWLENQLKSFKVTSESEEKGKIYKEYGSVIDQILTEIDQEKQRYQQTKQEIGTKIDEGGQSKTKPSELPKWVWGFIIVSIIAAVGSIIFVISRTKFRKSSKKV